MTTFFASTGSQAEQGVTHERGDQDCTLDAEKATQDYYTDNADECN